MTNTPIISNVNEPTGTITLRDWRAMQCMNGILANQAAALIAGQTTAPVLAAMAYACADALASAATGDWDESNWDSATWD